MTDTTRDTVPYGTFVEITAQKVRYGRYLDTKQWDQLSNVIEPDARLEFVEADDSPLVYRGRPFVFDSLAEFSSWFRYFFRPAETLHLFGPPDMRLQPDGVVAVTWAMEDRIIRQYTAGLVDIRGGGYYHEEWVRHDSTWRMRSLRLRRTYTKMSFVASVLAIILRWL